MTTPVYLQKANIPDGDYNGRMTGHVLKWTYNNKEVQCQTDLGVRGINCPVKFTVKNNKIQEDTIAQAEED